MLITGCANAQEFDFPSLLSDVQKIIWKANDGNGATWVEQQNDDGSWSDLSYTSKTNVTNSQNHMWRLYQIAQSCTESTKEHYNDSAYVRALKLGLAYWHDHIALDNNWWYNEIYYPQKLGEVMIMMRNLDSRLPLSSDSELSEADLLTLFTPRSNSKLLSHGTGANAFDIALHYVYRGILKADGTILEGVVSTLEPTLTENITADLTYQDHGPQLQIASYAFVFCNNLIKLSQLLANTPAAFNTQSSNFSKVLHFIRDVQIPSIRGQYWDYSVVGRAISRPNSTKGGLGYLQTLAEVIDTANASYYYDAMARFKGEKPPDYNVAEFHKHYWASDYTQHARQNYLFTVRNVSTRTVESEEGNNENLKGNYLSYGANFISVDGDEYYNIMPVWDWSMIPGTTIKYTTKFRNRADWGVNYGNTSFVGGVSDGIYGATVLDQNIDGVTAKKSWFFFDDEVVCLGAGIRGNDVRTTVNQCFYEGPVSYVTDDDDNIQKQSISSSVNAETSLRWLRHGKVSYYFPEAGNVKFTMKSQSGSWYDINKGYSTSVVSKYIFKLWFDHGNCSNADYAYVVVPETDSDEASIAYNVSKIHIIQNDASVQAVYNSSLDLLQAVFYSEGSISYKDRVLSVNQPCAILLQDSLLTIADPGQLQSNIKVDLTVNGENLTKYIFLPYGEEKGSSTQFKFSLPTSFFEADLPQNIKVYPNPVNTELRVELPKEGKAGYYIHDIGGRTILKGQIEKHDNIYVGGLIGGIYYLKVIDESGVAYTQRFIKL